MNAPPRLRVVDLFAGAGGLSAGFKGSGFTHVMGVELDSAAATTYRANHGEVFVGDINDWLKGTLPEADVVLGGPPCQGFSLLGKRDPEDPRNKLWASYLQAIARIKPKYFVMENVAPFTKSAQFEKMMDDLEHADELHGRYKVIWAVLNAADHGTPQARRRAIFLGYRVGAEPPQWPEVEQHRTVRDAIESLDPPRSIVWPASPTSDGPPGPYESRELHINRNYQVLSQRRFACIPEGGNRFNLPDELKAPCWLKHETGSGDVMGRLYWDRPAVTIRTEFFKPEKGRYLHPVQDRAITHLEAALLQGFPEDYKWHGTRLEIARQIGNAVPVPLAAALARSISAAHATTERDGGATGDDDGEAAA